jgi:hypothetical protein
MYTCMAGTPPQAGDQREEKDKMIPVKSLARLDYSDDLYAIVDSCLQLDWLKRPQTAFDLQKRLAEGMPASGSGDSGDRTNSIFDSISKPLSKLFSRKAENESP